MNSTVLKLYLGKLKTFQKKYRALVFWLLWGLLMSLVFGKIMRDYHTATKLFLGFGVYMGLAFQFLKSQWHRRAAVMACAAVALSIVWQPVMSSIQRGLGLKMSRSFLVNDVRQMASILESTHPDPYMNGGGKIGFHRRMQALIREIPDEGMTREAFYHHINPLLAALQDGHTVIWPPFKLDHNSPGGIPLFFHAIENTLYVAGITPDGFDHLIGSRLKSVESIPFEELINRQTQMRGHDNPYQVLRYLGYDGSLWYGNLLRHLVPEWQGGLIHIELSSPEGEAISLDLEPNTLNQDSLIFANSTIDLPSIERSDYVYEFMDEDKKTVFLRIENMYSYRETFEMELVTQESLRTGLAKYLYQRNNQKPPPGNSGELISGIPSVTELLRELVIAMKANQTENLIIDLRRNQGGNAFISTIFLYFLYGKEALVEFSDTKSIFIKKYSPLFWKQYPGWNIRDINKHQPIKLNRTDYDFSNYPDLGERLDRETAIRIIEEEASSTATFWNEYQSGEFSGYYCPKNIFLLCSPITNSSGYAFMYDQWAAGGKLVGVPSSQAGNGFGAWIGFRLRNSRLQGGVSHLYITHFRDGSDLGTTFRPDFELTYDDLNSLNFDPNAEVIYVLEMTAAN